MLKHAIVLRLNQDRSCVSFSRETRLNPTKCPRFFNILMAQNASSSTNLQLKCSGVESEFETHEENPILNPHGIDPVLIETMAYDALVWSSLHGLVVGDRASEKSGRIPGIGLVHAPISLLPTPFPERHWKQACEVAPIFNELVDRVSLDREFIQESLSRTKNVDAFTSRLLDIHSKILDMNKKEEIRLGLHRSDYMLDEETSFLYQIELNTISSSFPGLSCLVSELHRTLLHQFKQQLALDPGRIPRNDAVVQFAEALSKAWAEYNEPRAVVMFVVQTEERNMYDQHWLSSVLRERYEVRSIRKTLAEIDAQGKILTDGTLVVDDEIVSIVYFRAGYAPADYPSESEWNARLLIEQSNAIKCPSISYHLAGTKKIQQELARPEQLERFLENKDDIAKVRKCFAGLWSLDNTNIVNDAIEHPGFYVMKPQREGGGVNPFALRYLIRTLYFSRKHFLAGNNIYGDDVRIALQRMQKQGKGDEDAAYILMQRIFPSVSPSILMRDGVSHKENIISELGVYSTYLRNGAMVIVNDQSGYLMRTKVSSSNEGGVAAGFAVLDSIYLV